MLDLPAILDEGQRCQDLRRGIWYTSQQFRMLNSVRALMTNQLRYAQAPAILMTPEDYAEIKNWARDLQFDPRYRDLRRGLHVFPKRGLMPGRMWSPAFRQNLATSISFIQVSFSVHEIGIAKNE